MKENEWKKNLPESSECDDLFVGLIFFHRNLSNTNFNTEKNDIIDVED